MCCRAIQGSSLFKSSLNSEGLEIHSYLCYSCGKRVVEMCNMLKLRASSVARIWSHQLIE
jgi:hypothetical protein